MDFEPETGIVIGNSDPGNLNLRRFTHMESWPYFQIKHFGPKNRFFRYLE